MRAASDIADWWDKQHAISQRALDDFVQEYPGFFGVVLATAVATAMEVGKGTVDVLRFGEGLAEGTAGGVATDALRALSIVGSVGKGAKMLKEVAARRMMMKVIVDPGGGKCAYVSATQALKQTGQKAYGSVDDLARDLDMSVDSMGGIDGQGLRELMLKLKAKVGPLVQFKAWRDVESAVPHNGGVVSFGVKFKNGVGHRLYAYRDAMGRVKIMDRGGSGGKLPEVFDNLEAMARKYGSPVEKLNPGFEIKDVFMKFVGPKGTATLAMELQATTAGDAETIAQMFEAYKAPGNGKKTIYADDVQIKGTLYADPTQIKATMQMAPVHIKAGDPTQGGPYTVRPGDSLSKIAQKVYGNPMKFGVIYMANRHVIGPNPNLIHPGQVLRIPVLEAIEGIK